ncbi:hypothetical protein GOBAR_AA05951 [Gossypium barbadense]|uniref:Alpha-galactosidase n=1 Tax=Gossypium barbadense TaxID=3634 RepID=A0A2P5YGD7_GOSBA|nr:hypothetical protein GOBAR_AA05951 [Gossypium barbadense]
MKLSVLGFFCFFFAPSLCRVPSETHVKTEPEHASTPPRGWNSYDSFCWTISEEEFLQNAEIVSNRLKPHGYEYVVVDYLWYRRKVEGACTDSLGFDVIDEWGRPIPDPGRWPSSTGGKGFSEVAKKVHGMVKHDCVFGDDLDVEEITFVSEVLRKLDRPIIYSLSPGTSVTPAMAQEVSGLVNMYRITGDDWDTWRDVLSHFDITRDFSTAKMIGAKGLLGRSWPDLDMLPLGWLTDPGSNEGPHRTSNLNLDEQRTQITLWAMAKSPLMFGGDFPYITSRRRCRSKEKVLSQDLAEGGMLGIRALGLITCKDPKANGWSTKALDQDLEQICWKEKSESKFEEPPCLYKRKPLIASGVEMIYKKQYEGKLHLLESDGMELCLDGSPRRRLTSKEFGGGSFSPCKWDANQMWELNGTGSLVNSYSGLCATVDLLKVDAGSNEIRSWIATGRRGEIYLAIFNLNPKKTVISTNIADIGKVFPWKNMKGASCKYHEIWSGKSGVTKQMISIAVEKHGCSLFVLTCD